MKVKNKDVLKGVIIAVGDLLIKRKKILSYSVTETSKKTFSFKFKIFKTGTTKITISREIMFEKELLGRDIDTCEQDRFLIKVVTTISVHQLYSFFKKLINDYQLGYSHEMSVFENIEEIIKKDVSVLKSVRFVKRKQDLKGIDVRVTCRDHKGAEWVVPLQIKSSTVNQVAHKNKFPKIPSLVFLGKTHCPIKLEDQLIDICLSYEKDIIKHF
ncbi:MAG: hypothetical protein WCO58_01145 [bacterium]